MTGNTMDAEEILRLKVRLLTEGATLEDVTSSYQMVDPLESQFGQVSNKKSSPPLL